MVYVTSHAEENCMELPNFKKKIIYDFVILFKKK